MLMYEIYIKSFNDTNQDNIGDINGIIQKLPYLKSIGVDAIWITPFYSSPMVDNGYDISNYLNVSKEYGTITQVKDLINIAHGLNIKVFIDIVINHTSDEHEWFKKSILKIKPYDEYYIWSDTILNDWESVFKGSAWTYNQERGQYYLHRFSKEQPDLNHTNPQVTNSCLDILKYWAEIGVDGFRFDVINFLISDKDKLTKNGEENRINHHKTFDIIRYLKSQLHQYNLTFIGEVGSEDLNLLTKYRAIDLMDIVFCFNISSIKTYDLNTIISTINETRTKIDNPTIFFSSHDMARFNYRLANYDDTKYNVLLSLIYLTNYVSILYQGDELQLNDYVASTPSEMNDIQSINEYNVLIDNGVDSNQAFDLSMQNNRDFSRELIDWDKHEVSEIVNLLLTYRMQIINQELLELNLVNNLLSLHYTSVIIDINTEQFNITIRE